MRLHVKPCVELDATGYLGTIETWQETERADTSFSTTNRLDLSKLNTNTGVTKGSWAAGVARCTKYRCGDEVQERQGRQEIDDNKQNTEGHSAATSDTDDNFSVAKYYEVTDEDEDLPSNWTKEFPFEHELTQLLLPRRFFDLQENIDQDNGIQDTRISSWRKNSKKKSGETYAGKAVEKIYKIGSLIEIEAVISPSPVIFEEQPTSFNIPPPAADHTKSNNLPLYLRSTIDDRGTPNTLDELEDLAQALAKDMNLAPMPGFLDVYGGCSFNLTWEMQKFGLDLRASAQKRRNHNDILLGRLNYTSRAEIPGVTWAGQVPTTIDTPEAVMESKRRENFVYETTKADFESEIGAQERVD